jgi:hypothetical protein
LKKLAIPAINFCKVLNLSKNEENKIEKIKTNFTEDRSNGASNNDLYLIKNFTFLNSYLGTKYFRDILNECAESDNSEKEKAILLCTNFCNAVIELYKNTKTSGSNIVVSHPDTGTSYTVRNGNNNKAKKNVYNILKDLNTNCENTLYIIKEDKNKIPNTTEDEEEQL